MKICDRCANSVDAVPAVEKISFEKEGTVYDLCQSCKETLLKVLAANPERKDEKKSRISIKNRVKLYDA